MVRSILDFSLFRRAMQYRYDGPAQGPRALSERIADANGVAHGRQLKVTSVEVYECDQLTALGVAWRDLYERCLEPNIFLHPDFAIPAYAYLRPKGLRIIAVFDGDAPEGRLLALAPIVAPSIRFGVARFFLHKQSVLGLPLVDRPLAGVALAALLDAVKRLPSAPSALVFSDIPRDGATYRLLCDLAGPRFQVLGQYERAALFLATAPGRINQKTKARKNALRLLRRFGERGALSYRIWSDAEAPAAMSEFLALEAKGWKGASRTALGSAPDRAAFASEIAARFAPLQKLRIESLDLDGRPVAMGIMLEDHAGAYFWKTAYDEAYAAYSPGVLFIRELTHRLAAGRSFVKVDSCAMPDHPMIDRLWPDRLTIADIGIALAPGPRGLAALGLERLRRHGRALAKALLLRDSSGKAPLARTWRTRS